MFFKFIIKKLIEKKIKVKEYFFNLIIRKTLLENNLNEKDLIDCQPIEIGVDYRKMLKIKVSKFNPYLPHVMVKDDNLYPQLIKEMMDQEEEKKNLINKFNISTNNDLVYVPYTQIFLTKDNTKLFILQDKKFVQFTINSDVSIYLNLLSANYDKKRFNIFKIKEKDVHNNLVDYYDTFRVIPFIGIPRARRNKIKVYIFRFFFFFKLIILLSIGAYIYYNYFYVPPPPPAPPEIQYSLPDLPDGFPPLKFPPLEPLKKKIVSSILFFKGSCIDFFVYLIS